MGVAHTVCVTPLFFFFFLQGLSLEVSVYDGTRTIDGSI